MRTHSLRHLSDGTLLEALDQLVQKECTDTALIIAHIAEVDRRKLYLPAGFSSMFDYCVRRLHFSEEVAFKRIRAARATRRHPAVLEALGSGHVHLTGVVLLAPHLTHENVEELLAAATHKTRAEIELLVAARFPKRDVPTRIVAIRPPSSSQTMSAEVSPSSTKLDLDPVSFDVCEHAGGEAGLASTHFEQTTAAAISAPVPRPIVRPLAPERFAVQFTITKSTREKLQHAQALLSHRLPSGDVAEVFDRALDCLITRLEKEKFAATDKPRERAPRSTKDPRHIPAHVKRAVRERDQDQCTFVSDHGQRCGARKFLEFDHIDPVARGGQPTVSGLRLRCRGHNQYEADRIFGAGFMNEKRDGARRAAEEARMRIGPNPRPCVNVGTASG